jgi:hypothetical protein
MFRGVLNPVTGLMRTEAVKDLTRIYASTMVKIVQLMQGIITAATAITVSMPTMAITRTVVPMAITGISAGMTATLATAGIITTAVPMVTMEISATTAKTARVPEPA